MQCLQAGKAKMTGELKGDTANIKGAGSGEARKNNTNNKILYFRGFSPGGAIYLFGIKFVHKFYKHSKFNLIKW